MVNSPTAMQVPPVDPRVWKIPWRREGLPNPLFLAGEFQGHRSLVGYSLWGHKESDTTHAKLGGVYLPHK